MCWLPERFEISRLVKKKIVEDFRRFTNRLPRNLYSFILDRYGFDISGRYASQKTRIFLGKASGQLSMTAEQVEKDADAGLGFVILKTVIAQDSEGKRTMEEWVLPSSPMVLEKIQGASGRIGWTVTWKGRGWAKTFEEYLELLRKSLETGKDSGMLVVPSSKLHLPEAGEDWRIEEYEYTLQKFLEVWKDINPQHPLILEKNLSPTLAGSDKASKKETILFWLSNVTGIVKSICQAEVGIKVMNASFDDEFQVEMLRAIATSNPPPDFIIYANRLYDPAKTFDGQKGIAYGGPDLSQRNLRVLTLIRKLQFLNKFPGLPQLSATGDINSGRLALEYILRGASSCQMHTICQLPSSEYPMRRGTKTERALHRILFSPDDGLIAGIQYCKERWGGLFREGPLSLIQASTLHRNREFLKEVLNFNIG